METLTQNRLSTNAILTATAEYYQLPISRILSKTRKRGVVVPRQMVHYLAKRYKTDTMEEIALATGLTNHATVIYSANLISQEKRLYPDKLTDIKQIIKILRSQGYNVPRRDEG